MMMMMRMNLDQELPIINGINHQLRQCYVCTSRFVGCGEYLDPRYASKYIQPCASSCIIFRNPNDHDSKFSISIKINFDDFF